jgi:hypothetical protein
MHHMCWWRLFLLQSLHAGVASCIAQLYACCEDTSGSVFASYAVFPPLLHGLLSPMCIPPQARRHPVAGPRCHPHSSRCGHPLAPAPVGWWRPALRHLDQHPTDSRLRPELLSKRQSGTAVHRSHPVPLCGTQARLPYTPKLPDGFRAQGPVPPGVTCADPGRQYTWQQWQQRWSGQHCTCSYSRVCQCRTKCFKYSSSSSRQRVECWGSGWGSTAAHACSARAPCCVCSNVSSAGL